MWEANGRLGFDCFYAQPVDLVITDLEMPETNGLEVILELTRAITDALPMNLEWPSCLRQTIVKPLDLPTFLHAVQCELLH